MTKKIRTLRLLFSVPLIGSVLVGCSTVAPTVELRKISDPSSLTGNEFDTYYLQKSTITIEKTGTTKTADGTPMDVLVIASHPTESTKFKIGVTRADQFGVKTNLNITKLQNTDLIKEAGVEVTDKRVEIIGKIGAIVTKAAPILFNAGTGLEPGALPKSINASVLIDSQKVGRVAYPLIDAGDGVTIDFGPIPPDAYAISSFLSPTTMPGLIFAACRSATVTFRYQKLNYKKAVKVSDPNFYQIASFPTKGKIQFHSECGVSITSDKDPGVSSSADIVDALVAQGKAIKDAINAAKKDDK